MDGCKMTARFEMGYRANEMLDNRLQAKLFTQHLDERGV